MWRPWDYKKKPSKPSSPFSCSSFKDVHHLCTTDDFSSAPAKRTANVFHRVRLVNTLLRSWAPTRNGKILGSVSDPVSDNLIVVYFTSLRAVRSTFEDCKTVRSILQGLRVWVDERDVSMDPGFLKELRGMLGRSKLSLPRVFIGGRYMGGAEEIEQLHESGELKKLVERCPGAEPGTCHICGGYRFLLCNQCDGSCKLYTQISGFRICTACNENGLIRCPSCSHPPLQKYYYF
ncbi:hypothetical protein V6N13_052145 [Hibiscus sabdariffa]|uniref:Glutaredoxin domain-containing protein n=2 Tax=Hibiscus sabdariffa TaxID=183260 RepID=A0ABR2AWQ5_9ROSI